MAVTRQILATSGGFVVRRQGGWARGALVDHALALTGKPRPRICYLGTASGDSVVGVAAFYSAFAGCEDAVASHLSLFSMPTVTDVSAFLLSQDVIWVHGGSVVNLLAVWRAHGLDDVMQEAWERGIVLAGVSAGSICWHVGGTTDSFGVELQGVTNGLGLLPYSNGVHYDSEDQRRPLFHRLIAGGELPAGFATDDGAGLHYVGSELNEVVSERTGALGYSVERDRDGQAVERRLPTRQLPA